MDSLDGRRGSGWDYLRRGGDQELLQHVDQMLEITSQVIIVQGDRLPMGERLQPCRERLGGGHLCGVHQHRSHTKIPFNRRQDFPPDAVMRRVDPSLAALVGEGQPFSADQHKHHVARCDRVRDQIRVHIHENLMASENLGEPVK
jgi:hypothetical protein